MSKKTLFFSNIIGNVEEEDVHFNDYMSKYLIKNLDNSYSMIFINAPGLGGEEYYLSSVLNCFHKININFQDVLYIDEKSSKEELINFLENHNKIIYFLMGGNPYTQMEIIEKLSMKERIKNQDDLVIGFCAGAINLSKYSIITSDEDFQEPDSYMGIGREDICIEPHYNDPTDQKRNSELENFSKKYHTKIYCIPDTSIIYFEDGKRTENGKIYTIERN